MQVDKYGAGRDKAIRKFNYSRSNTILALLESMGYHSRLNIEAKETN